MEHIKIPILSLFFILLSLLNSTQSFFPLMSEGGSNCDIDCDPETVPVCGTDGRTYDSRCDIEKAKCQGHPVEYKRRGRCAEKARCEAQRALALEQSLKKGLFVPECKEDGSFAEVQCHVSTGYCWCVDEVGKPIRGSSIQNARPNCASKGKRTNKRRSSRGKKIRRGCGTNDRASFNANLIDIFQSEFDRVPHTTTSTVSIEQDPLRDTYEKQVIQWKFDQLDGNGDSYLKKKELRDLRRMAKRIVKPKLCAKTFAKFCDLDQDKKISRSEWSVCVGVDINNFSDYPEQPYYVIAEQVNEKPRYLCKCSFCNYSCKKPSDMKKHILVHTGEKPHTCPVCSRSFARRSNMIGHMQARHKLNKKLT